MKIAVLISGGVDSSVALRLLKDQGHELTAFYLKIWLEDELSFLGNCPWEDDLKYVRAVCKQAKIPLEIVPLQKEYFETVVAYTLSEVKAGRTPNPDVMCNNNIKFGLFLSKIDESFEKIATGHYAKIIQMRGHSPSAVPAGRQAQRANNQKNVKTFALQKSPDPIKDQTYFLANLKQKQLSKLIFPLGYLTKSEVRKLAQKYNLPNKNRKDSQGICFLGKFKYNEFLKHYLGTKSGDIVEFETGQKLGEHEGFWYYTIGQRKGIKLSGGPWFVVKKDTRRNSIYISRNYHTADKRRDNLEVENPNWFANKPPRKKNLQVKLRHGEHFYQCIVSSTDRQHFSLKLNKNDQGIAPGQFAVFYDKEICLGSAIIS